MTIKFVCMQSNDGFQFRPRENEVWVKTEMVAVELAHIILDLITDNPNETLVSCMGPKAVGKGIKALAIARDLFMERSGCDIICRPFFSIVQDRSGAEKTRITLHLESCIIEQESSIKMAP